MQDHDLPPLAPSVPAYQLFKSGQSPMSFEEILARFSEVGWPRLKSKNTLKTYISKLVREAQTSIEEEIDKLESRIAYQTGHIADLEATTDRVRKYYHRMLTRTRLRSLFADPEQVVERGVRALMNEAQKIVDPADWTKKETSDAWSAYLTFIKYVCGGLSYVEFMKGFTPDGTTYEADRGIRDLEVIVFYLEDVFPAASPDGCSKVHAEDIETLQSVVNGKTRIPRNAKEQMKTFCCAVIGKKPNFAAARLEAEKAARLLKRHWLDMKIKKIKRNMDLISLENSLKSFFDAPASGNAEDLEANVRNPLPDFQKLLDPGNLSDGSFTCDEEYSKLLERLQSGLRQYLKMVKNPKRSAIPPTRGLEKALEIVGNELSRPKPTGRQLKQELEGLLFKRSGSPVVRRIRPYELFRFAHEKGILTRELTAKRSKLNPEFVPTEPWQFSFSILIGHDGVHELESDQR